MVLHLAMHKINLAIHEMKQISVLVILAPKFRAKISYKVTLPKKQGEVSTNLVPRANFASLCFDNSQFISTAVKPGLSGALIARLGTDILSMEDKMVVYFNIYSHVNCRESKLN